jgi:hypothetical protein
MKKTAAKHSTSIKFNPQEFFTKNVGVMGLVVVLLLLIIYMMMKKVDNLEAKVMLIDTKQVQMETSETDTKSTPETKVQK